MSKGVKFIYVLLCFIMYNYIPITRTNLFNFLNFFDSITTIKFVLINTNSIE